MGRTSDARERIVEQAAGLIHDRGYAAVGVAEICSAAAVPKGSFYYFFESKQALTLAVIDEKWAEQRSQWSAILSRTAPAPDRLRDLFSATVAGLAEAVAATGAVTGCLFANLALELSSQDAVVRERISAVFDEQIAMVAEVVKEGVAAGEVGSDRDPGVVARSIVAQLEGLVMFAKLANDPGALDDLWQQSILLLGQPAASSAAE